MSPNKAFALSLSAAAESPVQPCAPKRVPANCARLAASEWVREILRQEKTVQDACLSAETAASLEDQRFYEAQCRTASELFAPDRACAQAPSRAFPRCKAL